MMLFLTKTSEKALQGKFSYGKKLRSSQSLNFRMKLPTKNGTPDYDFMNTYISAIHKVVIKEVVLYAEKKIQATKEVIKKIIFSILPAVTLHIAAEVFLFDAFAFVVQFFATRYGYIELG